MPASHTKVKVGIATAGRRDALAKTLIELGRQTRLADEVLICPASPEDCDESQLGELPYPCRVVRGGRGLTAQRNAILDACGGCDVIVFFDDDFYPVPSYLENTDELFTHHPEIVGATGRVLVDGSVTLGIPHAEAVALIQQFDEKAADGTPIDTYALYGCNMAVRVSIVEEQRLRFDERLPLYGWLEDIDLTRRLSRYGRLVRAENLAGVHLAVKNGRSSGVRLGYSQIANPWYLVRKGTLAPKLAMVQVSRNIAANLYHSLRPEPWIDRRGRLKGNALAALHLISGEIDPAHILQL
jgi:polysaccharide biosynthesis transport protein